MLVIFLHLEEKRIRKNGVKLHELIYERTEYFMFLFIENFYVENI